jgi:hypothetical protein
MVINRNVPIGKYFDGEAVIRNYEFAQLTTQRNPC